MTEEEIKQEVREQIIQKRTNYLAENYINDLNLKGAKSRATEEVDWFLSQPNLAIINPQAELPENPYRHFNVLDFPFEKVKGVGFNEGQQSLISKGWVKRIGGK